MDTTPNLLLAVLLERLPLNNLRFQGILSWLQVFCCDATLCVAAAGELADLPDMAVPDLALKIIISALPELTML